jgi:hypothetical protein
MSPFAWRDLQLFSKRRALQLGPRRGALRKNFKSVNCSSRVGWNFDCPPGELCDQTRGGSHWQTKSERNKLYSGQSWRLSRPKCALGPRPGARPDQGLRLSATGVFAGPGEPADCHRFRALKVPPGTPPRNEAGAAARRGSFYTKPLPLTGQWLVFEWVRGRIDAVAHGARPLAVRA